MTQQDSNTSADNAYRKALRDLARPMLFVLACGLVWAVAMGLLSMVVGPWLIPVASLGGIIVGGVSWLYGLERWL